MYNTIITDLEGLVVSSAWVDLPTTYPDEFKEEITEMTYLKYGIILTNTTSYYAEYSVTGLISIRIFYPKTESKRYAALIADKLNTILSKVMIGSGAIQTSSSNLQFLGVDPENTTLQRATFTVPFTYSGE
jgi:hypothetical protein